MKSLNKKIYTGFMNLVNPENHRIITPKVYANYTILLIGAFGILSAVSNYFIGLEESTYISVVLSFVSILYFFLNRFSSIFRFITFSGFIMLISAYNLYYIYNYGIDGPMAYFSYLLVYIILFFSNSTYKYILLILFLFNILVLYYLGINIENFSNDYESFDEQFFDHLISFFVVITSFVFLIRNLIKIQLKDKEIAYESTHLKSTFLANTSHDLRAPANSILSFSELIVQEDITKQELRKYIKIINSNSNQLLTLINDIFDLSIIESRNLVISPQNTNVNDVLEEIYSNFKRDIEVNEKNIDLNVHFGLPMTQSIIYIDPVRLKQILTNLLQNAVKHTKIGAIAFGYDKKMDAEELLFFVKDTGSGIPEDKLDNIFERYVTNINSDPKTKGTGLGLHITSSLVKLMNGKIWVESAVEIGSQFFFSVPIKQKPNIEK